MTKEIQLMLSKTKGRLVAIVVAILACGFVPQTAIATVITWHLNGVVFDDNTTMTGSFQYDTTTGFIPDFDITVQSGTNAANNYTPSNSTAISLTGHTLIAPGSYGLYDLGFFTSGSAQHPYIQMIFGLPSTPSVAAAIDAGGASRSIISSEGFGGAGSNFECGFPECSTTRYVTAGTVVVPEPATGFLFGSGLLGLVWYGKRKKTA